VSLIVSFSYPALQARTQSRTTLQPPLKKWNRKSA
jgi:hypothetical protein